MKKLALALGILLTTTVTAQSATIVGTAHLHGIEIHKTPITPIPGLNCNLAVASFQVGMERESGSFVQDIEFLGMVKTVKYYQGLVKVSGQSVTVTVACAEDGVSL